MYILTCRSSWVEISGTKYGLQNVVVLDCTLLPQFGIIHDIIVDNIHQPFFVCEKLTTDCFSSHYHAYEVIRHSPPVFSICKQSELYDYSVLSLYHVHSLFVSLKHHLVETLWMVQFVISYRLCDYRWYLSSHHTSASLWRHMILSVNGEKPVIWVFRTSGTVYSTFKKLRKTTIPALCNREIKKSIHGCWTEIQLFLSDELHVHADTHSQVHSWKFWVSL